MLVLICSLSPHSPRSLVSGRACSTSLRLPRRRVMIALFYSLVSDAPTTDPAEAQGANHRTPAKCSECIQRTHIHRRQQLLCAYTIERDTALTGTVPASRPVAQSSPAPSSTSRTASSVPKTTHAAPKSRPEAVAHHAHASNPGYGASDDSYSSSFSSSSSSSSSPSSVSVRKTQSFILERITPFSSLAARPHHCQPLLRKQLRLIAKTSATFV